MADLGSGVLLEESSTGSGTGNYNSFLRLQGNPEEEGFNTDDDGVAQNKNGIWTHSIQIGSLVAIEVDGKWYYEIRLDLNEGNAEGDEIIDLTDLRLFYSDNPATEADYDNGFVDLNEVDFDFGSAEPLEDIRTGSGTDDYRLLIPVELFEDADPTDYFTLYSQFTGSDGGFEEWRVLAQDIGDGLPGIHLEKTADPLVIPEGTPTDVTYTYHVTSTEDDDALLLTSFVDDNGTPGDTSDDIDLLDGQIDARLSQYYVSGDTDNDGLVDFGEDWLFTFTREETVINAGTLTNTANVIGVDEEGFNVSDDDTADVTVEDVDPTIMVDKVASVTQIQAGQSTPVTFTYTITNTSPASTDPITLTHLEDDNGTVETSDDKVLFDGDSTLGLGTYYVSGDDGDGLLESGESWLFQWTTDVTLAAGVTRTNVVTVDGHDDEDNPVTDTDDATVTAFNLGRTPGFWSNNGSLLWDGKDGTMPKAGGLGIVPIGQDLAYEIKDLDVDGDDDTGAGSRCYIMIGDWDKDGIADANENVLLISRQDALSLLNSSMKQQQDGRFMLARDLVASWLNYLGGSYVGNPDNATSTSVVHYIDEAVAWLQQTTDGNQIFLKSELTSLTKVGTSTPKWNTGIDLDDIGAAVNPGMPAAGQHDFVLPGANNDIDILGGSQLHTGLDHYNNFGFI